MSELEALYDRLRQVLAELGRITDLEDDRVEGLERQASELRLRIVEIEIELVGW
jgi:hypothetical protein